MALMTKESWGDLWQTIDHITTNRGKITSWQVQKKGTWSEDEREIIITVRLYETQEDEQITTVAKGV